MADKIHYPNQVWAKTMTMKMPEIVDDEVGDHRFVIIERQKQSPWTAQIFGNKDVIFKPRKGSEPNRFHRFMQRLCFGVVWVKD